MTTAFWLIALGVCIFWLWKRAEPARPPSAEVSAQRSRKQAATGAKLVIGATATIFLVVACQLVKLYQLGPMQDPMSDVVAAAAPAEPTGPKHIDFVVAIRTCKAFAKASARNPATVKFDTYGSSKQLMAHGKTLIISTATAQNDFGVPKSYRVKCLVDPDGKMEGAMEEAH